MSDPPGVAADGAARSPKRTGFGRDDAVGGDATPADHPVPFEGFDPDAARERCVEFLRDRVDAADADGVVVNLSGGLDSTVTATLAVDALGADAVLGLVLPSNKLGGSHARDAEALADALGIRTETVHLQPLVTAFTRAVPEGFGLRDEPVMTGNLVARLRMTMAYLAAGATGRLVAGTTNRSELLLGYYTKHGDGAADLLPIGHLYKTEVRALAAVLDVPRFVVEKRPTPGFLPGHTDRDDLGASYDVVDPVLRLTVDAGLDGDAVADRLGIDPDTVARLVARHEATAHKRARPPAPDRS